MKISQVSVFLENRTGRLDEVCEALGDAGINISTMNIAETDRFGILRMVVDDPQKALNVLKGHKFTASLTDIVAVEIPNQPGALAKVLKLLAANNLNIEYVYGYTETSENRTIAVFRFESPDAALDVFRANHIPVVSI